MSTAIDQRTEVFRREDERGVTIVDVTMYGWSFSPTAGMVSLSNDRADGSHSYVTLDLNELEEIVKAARKVRRAAADRR